jgi:hypothetical protein
VRRILPILLIGAGILLIAGLMYFNSLVGQPVAIPLPDQIAGRRMTNYTTGAQAVVEFENLHGKQFPVTSGAIGIYGDREITLWAASAPSEAIALEMTNAMQEKIAKGTSPFTPLEQFNQGDRTIYILEGMGQKHYYFQSKNLVIWLAVSPTLADQAIQQTLEVYP